MPYFSLGESLHFVNLALTNFGEGLLATPRVFMHSIWLAKHFDLLDLVSRLSSVFAVKIDQMSAGLLAHSNRPLFEKRDNDGYLE